MIASYSIPLFGIVSLDTLKACPSFAAKWRFAFVLCITHDSSLITFQSSHTSRTHTTPNFHMSFWDLHVRTFWRNITPVAVLHRSVLHTLRPGLPPTCSSHVARHTSHITHVTRFLHVKRLLTGVLSSAKQRSFIWKVGWFKCVQWLVVMTCDFCRLLRFSDLFGRVGLYTRSWINE